MAESFFQRLSKAVLGKSRVDDDTLDSIEEALVESDMGVDTTLKVIDALEDRVGREKYSSSAELMDMLREEISALIPQTGEVDVRKGRPHVILAVGVNGVGKTTTIGKLAAYYRGRGLKVILGAADTFRAAAVDQIQIWAERAGVEIVRQQMGSDPAAVAFDTVSSAVAKGMDVVLIDTAGRLHNRIDLMNELSKIRASIGKALPGSPDEVLLVIDASTGQNAFSQAREFARATAITGLAVTKLDGTAKGGVVVGVADQFNIPIRFIGTGEGIGDIEEFDRDKYVGKLFTL